MMHREIVMRVALTKEVIVLISDYQILYFHRCYLNMKKAYMIIIKKIFNILSHCLVRSIEKHSKNHNSRMYFTLLEYFLFIRIEYKIM